MFCRHCQKSRFVHRKGLCKACYETPGVRELYPSTSKYARRGTGHVKNAAPLPAVATTALPGTPEKIAVLEQRAKSGVCLFHPGDCDEWPDAMVALLTDEDEEDEEAA